MLKKILLALFIIAIAIQFYRPEKNISSEIPESDFLLVTKPSEDISSVIKASCYDCHSNNTVYPWYAEVAPVSWWIADHIDHGKEELNFSKWSTFSEKKIKHKLEEIIELVEKKEMPLESYLPMHLEAKLSDEQRGQLTTWVKSLQ